MVYTGSFEFLKRELLNFFKEVKPYQKTIIITHTNRMKQFLKEYLVSNLDIISNTEFYTLIDISKKLAQIEPLQEFDKKIIIKKAISDTGYHGFEGLVEEVSEIIQHIKEYKLDINNLRNDWIKQVYDLYEREKDGYFDREDTHKVACQVQTDLDADNIIIFGFKTVAPLHRELLVKLQQLCKRMYAFLPIIQDSGYVQKHQSFSDTVKFFESIINTNIVSQPQEEFEENINIGRAIYKFEYSNLPIYSENIKVVSCQDEEEEIRYVASKIADLVLSGVKFHQIGIVIPNISKYVAFIKEIFPKYFIPYYIMEDNRFIDSIPYRQLFNLFKLKENHLSKDKILNLLSQNILKIQNLEDVVSTIESAPYLDSLEDWEKHVFPNLKDESLKEIITRTFNLPDRTNLTKYIDTFRAITNYVDSQELREFAESIFTELENNDLYRRLFKDIDYDEFVSLVKLFFERENKTTRPNYETVNILSPNKAQGNNFQHIFILNLNSGVFPQTLRDEFLEVIGRNEHILMQQIASFSTLLERNKHVYLSFIKSSLYSKNLSPSFLINEILRITDKKPETAQIKDIIPSFPQLDSVEEIPKSYQFDFIEVNFPISVTSFSEYIICPYKFFLRDILNIYQPRVYDRRIPPILIGQFVHQLMQEIYMDILNNDENTQIDVPKQKIFQRFEEFLKQQLPYIMPSSRMFEYINLIKIRDNIIRFLEQDLQKIKKGEKIINPEFIEKKVSGKSLKGKIDRLDTEKGINVLYDYKTGGFSSKEEYQLVIYKKLLEKENVKVDKLNLVLLNSNKQEYINTINSNDIKEHISKIKKSLTSIKNKLFPKNKENEKNCNVCEYKEICYGGIG